MSGVTRQIDSELALKDKKSKGKKFVAEVNKEFSPENISKTKPEQYPKKKAK
ncbi:hypothetical protein M1506_00330 [Patescibacteria group bacterium]|nr:hypothetical protein [Patescibacteria group bacterium]